MAVELARTMATSSQDYSLAGKVDAEPERVALADMGAAELREWCEQRANLPAARIALDRLDLVGETT